MEELLKSNDIVVGFRQVSRLVKEGKIKHVFIATDTDRFLKNKLTLLLNQNEVKYTLTYTKQQMGKIADIQVDSAVIGILY